jgi:hypothetical protein
VAVLSFAPSLLILGGLGDIVVLEPLFVASLFMALLLPLSFLFAPTLLFVVTSLFLISGVSFSMISRNLLLGPFCAPLVFYFGRGS